MDAIPWYRSPLFIAAAVSIIAQLVGLFGFTDVKREDIESGVNGFFAVVALGATVWVAVSRWISKIQALALTKKGAEAKASVASGQGPKIPLSKGNALIGMLLILFAVATSIVLLACTTTPVQVIQAGCERDATYDVTRCVKSIGDTYEIYQRRLLEAVQNPSTPSDVRTKLQKADSEFTPAMVEVLRASRAYNAIAAEVKAGTTEEQQLEIANQNLERWIAQALPRLYALIDAFGG